jgi:general L-amino acid transport system substrate-binding protein
MAALNSNVVVAAMLAALLPVATQAQTLSSVRERGAVICGVSEGLFGFSAKDDKGAWSGLDVDVCRALAAAILDDSTKVNFVPLTADDRLAALQSGKIDVLSRNTTWTLSREAGMKLVFSVSNYYDGQGFLLRKARNATSALELDGLKICVQNGTTSERNVADYFRANSMKFELITLPNAAESVKAYDDGRCDVYTSDVAQLYAERLRLTKPGDHTILPDVISKEPLGPVVRQGDEAWALIVKWTHFAMINAEELGIYKDNVAEALNSEKPAVRRCTGAEGALGEQLGLSKDWATRIVRHVGNYGEAFERNVGVQSKLGIPRGLNNLWSNGGIQYAPPLL